MTSTTERDLKWSPFPSSIKYFKSMTKWWDLSTLLSHPLPHTFGHLSVKALRWDRMFISLCICVNWQHQHILSGGWNSQMEGIRDPRTSTRERNGWAEPGGVSSQRGGWGGRRLPAGGWGRHREWSGGYSSLIVGWVCLLLQGDYFNEHVDKILHFFNISCSNKQYLKWASCPFKTGHLLHLRKNFRRTRLPYPNTQQKAQRHPVKPTPRRGIFELGFCLDSTRGGSAGQCPLPQASHQGGFQVARGAMRYHSG